MTMVEDRLAVAQLAKEAHGNVKVIARQSGQGHCVEHGIKHIL
jgi:hypothetical protein